MNLLYGKSGSVCSESHAPLDGRPDWTVGYLNSNGQCRERQNRNLK
jgi:hypothetical protein